MQGRNSGETLYAPNIVLYALVFMSYESTLPAVILLASTSCRGYAPYSVPDHGVKPHVPRPLAWKSRRTRG